MYRLDARCHCQNCDRVEQGVYFMMGTCGNCGEKDIMVAHRVGERVVRCKCPVCGVKDVHSVRLPRPDEIKEVNDQEDEHLRGLQPPDLGELLRNRKADQN